MPQLKKPTTGLKRPAIDRTPYRALLDSLKAVHRAVDQAELITSQIHEGVDDLVKSANERIKSYVQRHSYRPKFLYRRQPKVITIALDHVVYRYGIKKQPDPDDPAPCFWERVGEGGTGEGDGEASNLHDALVACIRDFCDDGDGDTLPTAPEPEGT